jgi:hypothetical protein
MVHILIFSIDHQCNNKEDNRILSTVLQKKAAGKESTTLFFQKIELYIQCRLVKRVILRRASASLSNQAQYDKYCKNCQSACPTD